MQVKLIKVMWSNSEHKLPGSVHPSFTEPFTELITEIFPFISYVWNNAVTSFLFFFFLFFFAPPPKK